MKKIVEMDLQTFINEYKEQSHLKQLLFVRSTLHSVLVPYSNDRPPVKVISTHTSKSTLLPVYRIETEELIVTFRGNFYNWMVSVDSDRPVVDIFFNLFNKTNKIHPVYCEGFEKEWVHDCFSENKYNFTIDLSSEETLFTFFFLLATALGIR